MVQNLVVNLSFSNSFTLDQVVDRINSQLQGSNNSTLKQIVVVKERVASGTTENIRFLSTLSSGFSVSIGDLVNDHGVANTDSSALFDYYMASRGSRHIRLLIGIQDGRCVCYWYTGPSTLFKLFLGAVGKAEFG